jgi:hypothetical protein
MRPQVDSQPLEELERRPPDKSGRRSGGQGVEDLPHPVLQAHREGCQLERKGVTGFDHRMVTAPATSWSGPPGLDSAPPASRAVLGEPTEGGTSGLRPSP